MHRPTHPLAFLLALGSLALAGDGAAQAIAGVVLDDASDQPLAGALVELLDEQDAPVDETVADEEGAFILDPPAPGAWRIRTTLIGYADMVSVPLEVQRGDNLVVEVRMAIEAVALEPLVIRSRVSTLDHQLFGFYGRMDRGRRSGFGYFMDLEDIERLNAIEPTDLLRTAPGVRVVPGQPGYGAGLRMSGGCIPAIYVDGMQVNRYPLTSFSLDEIVPASSIEGIEVYRGGASQVGAYHDPGGCGLVLVWTRRGTSDGEPWSWKRFFAGMSLFGILFFLLR